MIFTKRHELQLAEIKALSYDLDRSAQAGVERLERIRMGLEQRAASNSIRTTAGSDLKDDRRRPGSVADGNDAAPLLAFVHIPKTAGGTVISMLAGAYSKQSVRDAGNYFRNPERTTASLARHRRNEARVTAGHVPYAIFRQHLTAAARYMTFLREPVDRVLSHYYRHIQVRDPNRGKPTRRRRPDSTGKVKADSIDEALVEMSLPQLNNLQTRFLSDSPPVGALPPSAVDQAKSNLRGFAFIGIQERFEESVVLLQRMLGLDLTPSGNQHVSRIRPDVQDIAPEQRELIIEHNGFDMELYRFAQGLFEEAVATVDESFARDVETVRRLSAAVNEEDRRALEEARDWLDRRLPPGSARTVASLRAEAEKAGIPRLTLKRASRVLEVRQQRHNGERGWMRAREPHVDDPTSGTAT